jgi:long-chain fatty acid transport protein
MTKLSTRLFVVGAIIAVCFAPLTLHAQGVMLRGVGAVNESVGGTATGMPLDASGALHWNPASISALPKNEMTFGLGLFQPYSTVETSGLPAAFDALNGSTKAVTGVTPVPNMGFVWSTSRKSPFTYGLGMSAAGGASTLYPQDNGNLLLAKHGRSANVVVLQVTPTVSAQLTERLSVGVAPIVDLASLNINPMALGRDAHDPLNTYGTRYIWGMGFQVGTFYDFQNNFKAGFMFKSPIWAEKLYYNGVGGADADTVRFQLNLPMTLSAGISYDGFRNTVIGMDVRYLDYSNTAGLDKGVDAEDIVRGLDWESVFSINVGMERKINNKLKGRLGYCWNENPIPSRSTVLTISAPMFTQHVFSCGFSYTFAKDLEMSVSYGRGIKTKLSGPFEATITPPGVDVAGTVTSTVSADSVFMGITKKW